MDILEVHEKIEAYKKMYYCWRNEYEGLIHIGFNLPSVHCHIEPFIFDEYSEFILLNVFLSDEYYLDIYNDYLIRIKKSNGYKDYFHKFLWEWKYQMKVYNYEHESMREGCYRYDRSMAYLSVIHHKNHNKHDNRISNLTPMDEKEHEDMHEEVAHNRAFNTWSEKTGSEDHEAFDEWLQTQKETPPEY